LYGAIHVGLTSAAGLASAALVLGVGALAALLAPPPAQHRAANALSGALATLRAPGARHRAKVADIAFQSAERVVAAIKAAELVPERVVTTSQGEVAFYFRGQERTAGGASRRYGTIVCDSDGDTTVLLADRVSAESKAWRIDGRLSEALAIIGDFVDGDGENASG
jgi:hypothetical protein